MKQMGPDAYGWLNGLGDYARERLRRLFHDRHQPAQVCGAGSMFLVHLTGEALIDYRSLSGFSRNNPVYGNLCHQMLQRGIIISPRGVFGCLSTPMTESEVDAFIEALDCSLAHS
jgi:glutamate-1-semialdehyde aminotransferase